MKRYVLCAVSAASVWFAGCSSGEVELARVQGQVTLDGKPLPNAAIIIAPISAKGGPAYAVTDAQGRYELTYTHEREGAVVGKCTVRIKTGFQSIEDEERSRKRPELVPDKYNTRSTLTIDVQPGGGPYDFNLSSK